MKTFQEEGQSAHGLELSPTKWASVSAPGHSPHWHRFLVAVKSPACFTPTCTRRLTVERGRRAALQWLGACILELNCLPTPLALVL